MYREEPQTGGRNWRQEMTKCELCGKKTERAKGKVQKRDYGGYSARICGKPANSARLYERKLKRR